MPRSAREEANMCPRRMTLGATNQTSLQKVAALTPVTADRPRRPPFAAARITRISAVHALRTVACLPDYVAPSCSPAPFLFLAPLFLCSLVIFRARVLVACLASRWLVTCACRACCSTLPLEWACLSTQYLLIDDGKKMSLWPRHYHVSGKAKLSSQFGLADMPASSVVQCLQSKPGIEIAISCDNRRAACCSNRPLAKLQTYACDCDKAKLRSY